ncbi:J domain-containing protein [Picosynechococcus sp. PCC 73109]|uniref:J domain-containing protein n=1 Tax=Picosynechococcus sp. PCC 73109 TaxID=374982 RepID=UPI0007458461|nr:DnaJ domain-containing protein [Picosynechococcus sp. PCC 73109]AMA09893.1 molecular chaperone DnaJ [Picosynechococcus sp. PCC 73109]
MAKSKRKTRPNINYVKEKIADIADKYNYDPRVLLEFAEYVNGGKFKPVELSMQQLKNAVVKAFNCKNYQELKKNGNFKLYVKDENLKLNLKTSWKKIYREWVDIPESEKNDIGYGCINGINIFKNFRPWEVFELNPQEASAEDIKTAFRKLALKYHPDHGGDQKIFAKLQHMRDSLLAAY